MIIQFTMSFLELCSEYKILECKFEEVSVQTSSNISEFALLLESIINCLKAMGITVNNHLRSL